MSDTSLAEQTAPTPTAPRAGHRHPTVSVIVPAYKAAATIGRTLDSLLAQTRQPDEILVIDDGSPDDLVGALAPYRGQVRLVRKPNGGASSARNLGLDMATGDFIAFVDADDYWEPAKLQKQLAIFEQHPEVAIVAGRFLMQEPDSPQGPSASDDPRYFERVLRPAPAESFDVAKRVWTSVMLARKSAIGSHRFDESLSTAEDADLWLRLVTTHPVYLVWEPLATQVLTHNSLSRSDVAADCANMLAVIRRHAALFGPAGVRRWEVDIYGRWAAGHLGEGNAPAAVAPAWQRFRRRPWSVTALWILVKSVAWAGVYYATGLKPIQP